MTYVEGFIMPVPRTNRDGFIRFSTMADKLWAAYGADRILECWPDEDSTVRTGDIFTAAQGQDCEAMIFSWIEWRDKNSRNQAMPLLLAKMASDPRFDQARHPLPFDNDRVISGCFRTLADHGEPAPAPYVQGFILSVAQNREAHIQAYANASWEGLYEVGALRLLLTWEDECPADRRIDFPRLAKSGPEEKVAFAVIEWPSRAVCEAAAHKFAPHADPPFDQRRMMSGGFSPVVLAG